jgi:2-keto-3-deoxy-L-rhamnonate aldolase RhmA
MAAETKVERQNERDLLTETGLDGVVGGATDLSTQLQCLSDYFSKMSDMTHDVIANIR